MRRQAAFFAPSFAEASNSQNKTAIKFGHVSGQGQDHFDRADSKNIARLVNTLLIA
jgi:hypothetical protein